MRRSTVTAGIMAAALASAAGAQYNLIEATTCDPARLTGTGPAFINASGTVVYGGLSAACQLGMSVFDGIYMHDGTTRTTVAQSGTTGPIANSVWDSLYPVAPVPPLPSINELGSVGFRGKYTDNNTTPPTSAITGVFVRLGGTGTISTVAKTGDVFGVWHVTGVSDTAKTLINRHDQVVFMLDVAKEVSPGVLGGSLQSIWYWDPTLVSPTLVAVADDYSYFGPGCTPNNAVPDPKDPEDYFISFSNLDWNEEGNLAFRAMVNNPDSFGCSGPTVNRDYQALWHGPIGGLARVITLDGTDPDYYGWYSGPTLGANNTIAMTLHRGGGGFEEAYAWRAITSGPLDFATGGTATPGIPGEYLSFSIASSGAHNNTSYPMAVADTDEVLIKRRTSTAANNLVDEKSGVWLYNGTSGTKVAATEEPTWGGPVNEEFAYMTNGTPELAVSEIDGTHRIAFTTHVTQTNTWLSSDKALFALDGGAQYRIAVNGETHTVPQPPPASPITLTIEDIQMGADGMAWPFEGFGPQSGYGLISECGKVVYTIRGNDGSDTWHGIYTYDMGGLCVCHCDSDFDNDGDFGTDADIEAFYAAIANPCETCDSIDINCDGEFTDADIDAFFRVMANGPCRP